MVGEADSRQEVEAAELRLKVTLDVDGRLLSNVASSGCWELSSTVRDFSLEYWVESAADAGNLGVGKESSCIVR